MLPLPPNQRLRKEQGIRREAFAGRTYADFQSLVPFCFCEMDTVLSAKGSDKCILTFYLPETELLTARLLNRRT